MPPNPSALAIFFGIAAYIFEGIGLVVDQQKSMVNPRQFEPMMWGVYVAVLVIVIPLGWVGYLAFGSTIHSVIIEDLPQDSIITKLGSASLCAALWASIPIQLFPVFALVENTLFSPSTPGLVLKRIGVRTIIPGILTGVAISIPHFGLFMSLIGGFGCGSLAFEVPALLYLVYFWRGDRGRTLTRFEIIACSVLFIFGTAAAIVSTATTLQQLIEGKD
jgi:proton-coupled amino acid transporter